MTRLLPMLLLLAMLLLPLAACGAEPPAGTNTAAANAANAAAAAPQVDYLARIRAMPQGQRTAVFLRAIRDAGRPCQEVTELTEVTPPEAAGTGGPATWSARCDDGGRWVVAIAPDGTATVTDQAQLGGAAKG